MSLGWIDGGATTSPLLGRCGLGLTAEVDGDAGADGTELRIDLVGEAANDDTMIAIGKLISMDMMIAIGRLIRTVMVAIG